MHEIRTGQVWSVYDSTLGARRQLQITTPPDDPADPAARVRVINLATGRTTHPRASTIQARWRLERDPR